MNWHDYFRYDDGSLIWVVPVGRKIRVGDTAGYQNPRGYVMITLAGKKYGAHRIIWEMLKGPIPAGMEVDHEDGNRSHNKIGNLSLVTNEGNHKNMAKRKDNTSGATGVYQCKVTRRWVASARIKGKMTYFGRFDTMEEAAAERRRQNAVHGFSARHGT